MALLTPKIFHKWTQVAVFSRELQCRTTWIITLLINISAAMLMKARAFLSEAISSFEYSSLRKMIGDKFRVVNNAVMWSPWNQRQVASLIFGDICTILYRKLHLPTSILSPTFTFHCSHHKWSEWNASACYSEEILRLGNTSQPSQWSRYHTTRFFLGSSKCHNRTLISFIEW